MRRGLVGLLCIIVMSVAVWAADTLDVYFIDVGQGDAILVDYGDWECLIDTGYQNAWLPDDEDWTVLRNVICPPIEAFVLSHADRDHYSAFVLLASEFGIASVLHGPDEASRSTVADLIANLAAESPEHEIGDEAVYVISADSTEALQELELDWHVHHPTSAFAAEETNKNENSLVMSLTFGAVMFVFAGDVGEEGASHLSGLEFGAEHLILKTPHHGSNDGLTLLDLPGFVPEIAVVSVGGVHTYGQPELELMTTLAATSTVYVTTLGNPNGCFRSGTLPLEDFPSIFADVGTVLVSTDGDSVWVTTSSLGRSTKLCSADEQQ